MPASSEINVKINSDSTQKKLPSNSVQSQLIALCHRFDIQLLVNGAATHRLSIAVSADYLAYINRATTEQPFSLSEAVTILLRDAHVHYELVDQRTLIIKTADLPVQKNALKLEEVLVTGSISGKSKRLSSVSISSIDQVQMQRYSGGLANTLELIPGLWVENSGGEANNNVTPRGLPGGDGFRSIGVQEDGLAVVYDGIWVDYFVREDIGLERIETIRGGNSGIYTVNGPGALMNFISRKPEAELAGDLRFTWSDYDYQKMEGFITGPIDDQWRYSLAGFYRQSAGIRDTGYDADDGGQLRAQLLWQGAEQKLLLQGRWLDDTTTFYTPIPLKNVEDPEAIASLDANYGTLLGPDLQQLSFLNSDGSRHSRKLDKGTQTQLGALGAEYQWHINDQLTLENRYRYSDIGNSLYSTSLNGGNNTLVKAKDRLLADDAQALLAQYQDQGATDLQYRYVQSGARLTDIDTINGNGLVSEALTLYADYAQQQHINDLRLNYHINDHQLRAGFLYADSNYTTLPLDRWEGRLLIDVKNNPERLDIAAINSQGQALGYLTDQGFLSYDGYSNTSGKGRAKSQSLYFTSQSQLSKHWQLDFGVRYEQLALHSQAETDQLVEVAGAYREDGSDADNISANNWVREGSGIFYQADQTYSETSFSLGVNYSVDDSSSIFVQLANSYEMPRVLSFGQALANNREPLNDTDNLGFGDALEFKFIEAGYRFDTEVIGASITAFHTEYRSKQLSVFDLNRRQLTLNTEANGIELESYWQPSTLFGVVASGVWQDAVFDDISAVQGESLFNGNKLTRVPQWQARVMPTINFDVASGFIVIQWVGKRYSDIANKFELPAYAAVDLGVDIYLSENSSLTLSVKNVFNSVGLTEGNPRSGLEEDKAEYFYARPIFGRTLSASLNLNF